jgi:hypothetical protein
LPDLSQGFSPPEAKMERSRNPVKGSTSLRTAIIFNLHEPDGKRRIPDLFLNLHEPDDQCGIAD